MFSDTQKQIEKQLNHEKSRAYNIISSLKQKQLSNKEILECIDVMASSSDNNETQQEVLNKARSIVAFEVEQELIYEANGIIPSDIPNSL